MRALALIAATALTIATCLVSAPVRAADPVFPMGSRIGLTPPVGFSASVTFRGFEDRGQSAAMLTLELPAQAFAEIDKTMTAKALKTQGVTVEKRESITLKTGKGILITGRQLDAGAKVRKWILIGATPDVTALVTVIVPETAANIYSDAVIREALASLTVRPTIPIEEQIGLLPFKLDDLAGLRAVRVVGPNTVFLTDGPKDTFEADEQPMLIVSAAAGGPAEAQQRDNFARSLFSGLGGFKDLHVVGTDVFRMEGQQTHQLLAEAKDPKSDTDMRVVQWLRFGNGAYIRFVGIARADGWLASLARFRAIRDSVGPRQ